MDLSEFQQKCNSKICLRKTFTDFDKDSKSKCLTQNKQSKCYDKYISQLEKDTNKRNKKFEELRNSEIEFKVDEKWIETRQKIIQRDRSCRVWKCLSIPDKKYILNNYQDDYMYFYKMLDVDHIIPKSVRFDLYYDLDNLLLMSRYFHRLLTDYRHPVTQKKITDEEKKIIYEKIKKSEMI